MMRTFDLSKSPTNLFYFHVDAISNQISLCIPEERLSSNDFEKGLTHELTEIILRQIVFPMIETAICSVLLHEITVLSLGRYETVKKQYDRLEATFWNNGELYRG